MNKVLPDKIKKVGFDFNWHEEKVWKLDLAVEEMDIKELEWHFDYPFWNTKGESYNLSPNEVINNKKLYKEEYERSMNSDLSYPLDIMFWKGRWVMLDGLHRLVKAKILGFNKIKVRKVSETMIPLIL